MDDDPLGLDGGPDGGMGGAPDDDPLGMDGGPGAPGEDPMGAPGGDPMMGGGQDAGGPGDDPMMGGDPDGGMGDDPMGGEPGGDPMMGGGPESGEGDLLDGLNDTQKDAVKKYAKSMKPESRVRRMYDRIISETLDQIMNDRVELTSDRYEKRMPKEYEGRRSPFISPY